MVCIECLFCVSMKYVAPISNCWQKPLLTLKVYLEPCSKQAMLLFRHCWLVSIILSNIQIELIILELEGELGDNFIVQLLDNDYGEFLDESDEETGTLLLTFPHPRALLICSR